MKNRLSVLMITKNSAEIIDKSLSSIKELANEIIIIDDFSKDKTVKIAQKYNTKIFLHHEEDLGKQRAYGLKKVKENWILVLDPDEIIPKKLMKEINKKLLDVNLEIEGFIIPYQNHLFNKKINYGGENYQMLRLFKKQHCKIMPSLLHEKFELKSEKIGVLKNKIYHYSYRSLIQIFKKFTHYSMTQAKQNIKNNEKTSLKKIFLYPPHMFWARFIKDKGYKDGLFRIPLDLGFSYMEFLSYFLMIFIKKNKI